MKAPGLWLLLAVIITSIAVLMAQKYAVTTPLNTVNQSLLYPGPDDQKKDLVVLGSLFPLHNHSSTHMAKECGPLQVKVRS